MLDQNFQPDADQDESADDLDFLLEEMSRDISDSNSCQTEGKCYRADDGDGGNDGGSEHGKGDAHGQGVDAGGEGKKKQDIESERIGFGFRLFQAGGFINHLASDNGQQGEGDPVVESGHEGLHGFSGEPSDDRHDSLEESEGGGHTQGVTDMEVLHGNTACHGDGEGIHGEADGQKKDFKESHDVKKGRALWRLPR